MPPLVSLENNKHVSPGISSINFPLFRPRSSLKIHLGIFKKNNLLFFSKKIFERDLIDDEIYKNLSDKIRHFPKHSLWLLQKAILQIILEISLNSREENFPQFAYTLPLKRRVKLNC